MKGGLVSESGAVLLSERRPTPRTEGPEAVVAAISDFISHLAGSGDGIPAGVGLAVPGLVTESTAVYATNLGWRDVPATDFTTLDIPVMLGHDVRTGGPGGEHPRLGPRRLRLPLPPHRHGHRRRLDHQRRTVRRRRRLGGRDRPHPRLPRR
ncbi:hypothetical protein GCM10020001_018360 [Nonomuraea salmonea]